MIRSFTSVKRKLQCFRLFPIRFKWETSIKATNIHYRCLNNIWLMLSSFYCVCLCVCVCGGGVTKIYNRKEEHWQTDITFVNVKINLEKYTNTTLSLHSLTDIWHTFIENIQFELFPKFSFSLQPLCPVLCQEQVLASRYITWIKTSLWKIEGLDFEITHVGSGRNNTGNSHFNPPVEDLPRGYNRG